MTALFRVDVEQIPSRGDLALAASLLGVAVLSGFYIDANRPDTVEPSSWWHWLLIATPPILVAFRRLAPILVTGLASVAQALIWVSDLPEVLLSIMVILYAAASEAGSRGLQVALGASAGLTAVTAVGVRIADDVTPYQLPLIVLTCGTAIALGANAASQRRLASALATEAAETRLRSEHERAQAVASERSHIARELHDVIGHTLSVIAVRAEAADRVADSKPEAAGAAVADIAGAARAALTDTRRVLAGLRQSSIVELAPPPGFTSTKRLVAELSAAGIDATITETGCDRHSPPAVVVGGAHRIVQESLTNAVKHGGAEVSIDVTLSCRPDELHIRVANSVSQFSVSRSRIDQGGTTGTGIAGMTERAQVLGGTFEANLEGNSFVVTATLPTGQTSSFGRSASD